MCNEIRKQNESFYIICYRKYQSFLLHLGVIVVLCCANCKAPQNILGSSTEVVFADGVNDRITKCAEGEDTSSD